MQIRLVPLTASVLLFHSAVALADIPCPPMPTDITHVNHDVKSDIKGSAASLGKIKAGEVSIKTEVAAKNLFEKYPNVDKVLALQMMAATYCTLLRDAKSLSEKEKLDRWERFQEKVLNLQSSNYVGKSISKPQPISQKPAKIDPKIARFGVTLGWQLGRYEIIFDSPYPEARSAVSSVEQDIRTLLEQDGFPKQITGLNAQDLIHAVLLYYGTSNLEKHATILLGIAAMRASMVGKSNNQANNELLMSLAESAVKEIDSNVIHDKDKLFKKIINKKPATTDAIIQLLYQ